MFGKKIVVALISSVSFTLLVSLLAYTPKDEVPADNYHFGFMELFILYSLYITPIYFTFGIGVSWTIDQYIEKYSEKFRMYVLIGGLIGFLMGVLLFLQETGSDNVLAHLFYFFIGVIASVTFWLIEYIYYRVFNK
ncbi:hypothetical protein M3557_15825 [Bhargavaea ginsengi]|uniref:hypothetical protein n=1 Tax=Bhargavaea ginsengi TaxID=426757 RepID=UPI00204073E6|nr:hypothetical protein [Bhargavaea ginsengi]MCM3089379.1 hypothetical protein [Bhargavaea ginsengi]